jgi:hypothetical protein
VKVLHECKDPGAVVDCCLSETFPDVDLVSLLGRILFDAAVC